LYLRQGFITIEPRKMLVAAAFSRRSGSNLAGPCGGGGDRVGAHCRMSGRIEGARFDDRLVRAAVDMVRLET
jgi:hypothetical protein